MLIGFKIIFNFMHILVFFFPSPKFMNSFLATVSGVHLGRAHHSPWYKVGTMYRADHEGCERGFCSLTPRLQHLALPLTGRRCH